VNEQAPSVFAAISVTLAQLAAGHEGPHGASAPEGGEMMTKRRVRTASLTAVTALAALFLASGDALAHSGHHDKSCSVVGTWLGVNAYGDTWMDVVTPGPNATEGQVVVNYVSFDPTLGGYFPTVTRMTNAAGVWETKGRQGTFTFVYYALDADDAVVYTARIRGEVRLTGCNHKEATYTFEGFLGESLDDADLLFGVPGTSTETRMQLAHRSAP
jgi:hypothetical protein